MGRSIVLELVVQCGRCRTPVQVPSVCSSAACERCGAAVALPDELWTAAFPPSASATILRRLARGGVEYRPQDERVSRAVWIRRAPFCPGCGAELDEVRLQSRLAAGHLPCAACGRKLAVRAADELCRAVQPDALAVVSQFAEEEPTTHRTPVIPSCPACGAPLLADGGSRSVACRGCGTTSVLPDEVWAQFHPVEIPRPFFLLCAHGLPAAELAGRPDLAPEQLEALARNADPEVRQAVARNPSAAPNMLARLALDADVNVRRAAAAHPAAPPFARQHPGRDDTGTR